MLFQLEKIKIIIVIIKTYKTFIVLWMAWWRWIECKSSPYIISEYLVSGTFSCDSIDWVMSSSIPYPNPKPKAPFHSTPHGENNAEGIFVFATSQTDRIYFGVKWNHEKETMTPSGTGSQEGKQKIQRVRDCEKTGQSGTNKWESK